MKRLRLIAILSRNCLVLSGNIKQLNDESYKKVGQYNE